MSGGEWLPAPPPGNVGRLFWTYSVDGGFVFDYPKLWDQTDEDFRHEYSGKTFLFWSVPLPEKPDPPESWPPDRLGVDGDGEDEA